MTPLYKGTLIANVKLDRARGNRLIAEGLADLVAFGRPYIANPDLVQSFAENTPLAEVDWETVYASAPHGIPITQPTNYPNTTPAVDHAKDNTCTEQGDFDTLCNKRAPPQDERFWSPTYIQHSAHIAPGREGLFNLVRSTPNALRCENQLFVAEGDYVIAHGRFTGIANAKQLSDGGASEYPCAVPSFDDSLLNQQRERQRLAANYASMTDGELQRLAGNAESLTEVAWDALEDEMDRRNLEPCDDSGSQPRQEMEVRELVTIRQFRDLPEALLAKGSLESSGIECFLADENLVRLDWFISNFIGGIKLKVHEQDVANAQKILDEPILEGLYVHGVGLYEQPRCPHCQSLDVNFQELDRPIAYISAFLRVPMPLQRPAWHCHSCDAEWDDDSSESAKAESSS